MKENVKSDNTDEKITKKMINKKKLSVRDYITMALILVLVYIIYAAVGMPMGLTVAGIVFMHAACSLLWGTIFLLLYTRVNKKWTVLIFGIILGLIQVMNFWPTSVSLALGGVAGEILWQKTDRKKFKTMVACFTIQIASWYIGIYAPLIIFFDLSKKILAESYVEMYTEAKTFTSGPMFFIGLGVTIICSVAGAFLGKILLKKHFRKAGIV